MCLRGQNTAFEGFSRLTLRLKSKRFACYKLRIYELTDRGIVCDKAYFDLKNFRPLRINPWTFSFNTFPFYLTNPQHSVSRQAHPLLRRGLGRHHLWAWGGRILGVVFVNFFPFRFPSTPFCVVKDALLQCKRASFDV